MTPVSIAFRWAMLCTKSELRFRQYSFNHRTRNLRSVEVLRLTPYPLYQHAIVAVIRRYELTDEEWERLKAYFPERKAGTKGRPPKDTRQMLNGIFWILRSGASWRDLPERYGPWQTVYKHFAKWEKEGIFEQIFTDLAADADMQDISLDSTCIKAHKASAGAKKETL